MFRRMDFKMNKAVICLFIVALVCLDGGERRVAFSQETYAENALKNGQLAAVMGEDNRRALSAAEAVQYQAIGVLQTEDLKPRSKGYSKGTGFLVGPNVIVTARHVIETPTISEFRDSNWSFSILNAQGKVLEKVRVLPLIEPPTHDAHNDLAALVLELNFETEFDFLSLPQSYLQSNYVGEVKLIGFHADRSGLTIQNCRIAQAAEMGALGLAAEQFMHSCDTAKMSSGSPIIADIDGQDIVVGINTGYRDSKDFKQWSKFTTGIGVRIPKDFIKDTAVERPLFNSVDGP